MTVEAVLVFTLVLFALMAVIYSFMLMYQYSVVQNAASRGAAKFTEVAYGGRDIEDIEEIYDEALRLIDREMSSGLLSGDYDAEISFPDSSIWEISRVNVTVTQQVMKPISQIMQFFGADALEIRSSVEIGISGVARRRAVIDSLDFAGELLTRVKKFGDDLLDDLLFKWKYPDKKTAKGGK